MNREIPVEQLLRWRLAQAEAEAPPLPHASHWLELARPWWETWPERFRSIVDRLSKLQVAYGHAMAEPRQTLSGHPVPVVIARAGDEIEASARVLYLDARKGRLRLRFQLEAATESADPAFDVTFVPDAPAGALFSATAVLAMGREYRVDAQLAAEAAEQWETWKVTDRIPYRLILRPGAAGE